MEMIVANVRFWPKADSVVGSQIGNRYNRAGGEMRLLLVSALLMTSVRAAMAEAILVRADPAPDSVAAVMQIELQFSEMLHANGSSIALFNERDDPVAGVTVFAGKILFFKLEHPPAPGLYKVRWRAMAGNGRLVEGSYRFSSQPVF